MSNSYSFYFSNNNTFNRKFVSLSSFKVFWWRIKFVKSCISFSPNDWMKICVSPALLQFPVSQIFLLMEFFQMNMWFHDHVHFLCQTNSKNEKVALFCWSFSDCNFIQKPWRSNSFIVMSNFPAPGLSAVLIVIL